MILDGVIRPAGEYLGDLGPLVPVYAVGAHEGVFLRLRPGILLDGRVQLIVPPGKKIQQEERFEGFS